MPQLQTYLKKSGSDQTSDPRIGTGEMASYIRVYLLGGVSRAVLLSFLGFDEGNVDHADAIADVDAIKTVYDNKGTLADRVEYIFKLSAVDMAYGNGKLADAQFRNQLEL